MELRNLESALPDNVYSESVVPNLFNAFLPSLILELFIPSLRNFHSSPVRVRRLVLTAIGKMVFIDDKNLINKSGTKTMCCQIVARKFVNKNVR